MTRPTSCGSAKTILGQFSNVKNRKGVEYLQAVVPDGYSVELLRTTDEHAMHIDATILPLREGLLVYNPQRVTDDDLRRHAVLRDWELRAYPFVPQPRASPSPPMYMCSPWLVLNALSLDERRIVVEEQDVEFAAWVRDEFGMEPIMCSFQHVNSIGGSFTAPPSISSERPRRACGWVAAVGVAGCWHHGAYVA